MRVLIYGGRTWANPDAFEEDSAQWEQARDEIVDSLDFLDSFVPQKVTVIVSGMADGADTIGIAWAHNNNVRMEGHSPDWETHGKKAGPIRNQEMLDSGIDLAIEFPGGRGTADMRRRLEKAGVPIIEYE